MTLETANKGVILAAVSSPWWLPVLQKVSEYSAMALPVAGLLWIILQAGIAIYKFRRGK
jgi:hypothetical protein